MANNTGWIKIHRTMLDWEWYDDINTKVLFIHCLLLANHKAKEWHGITIERGTFITSYHTLAEETGLSYQQVRTSLNKLKVTHELTFKPTNKYSVISICNYDTYQVLDELKQHSKSQSNTQSDNSQVTTTKNVKNVRNKETSIVPPKNKFIKPTKAELDAYCEKMKYDVNTEKWLAHYNSNGWKVGKNPMKSWQSALTTWHLKDAGTAVTQKPALEVEWYVYWCYHCQEESFKKELGNYRCKKPDCQCEVKGSMEEGNLQEIGAKLEHRRNIFKKESK